MNNPPKVLICDKVHKAGIGILKDAGFDVTIADGISYEELLNVISDYEVVVVRSRTRISRDVINAAKNLRVIARVGAGTDNIDVDAARERGIDVVCAGDAVANATAELTVGLMLALSRNICLLNDEMKRGGWPKGKCEGVELKGKTVGIIGAGRVGRRVAELTKAFGMEVLLNDVVPIPDDFLKKVSGKVLPLIDLLKVSDYITVHVSLTPSTRKLLNKDNMSFIKEGAFLVNTSRGAVIDEDALYEALVTGRLRGAALDVYSVEPPVNRKLLELPNVICTPHIGAQTLEAQERASVEIASKIIRLFSHTITRTQTN
ncbi:MAG: D-2-hydroxyacid dehydrogenase [Nitrososphaerota archaeon]|nr:D-2-hydroxyacid dehydrogenase [Aigarchaeota archaeon]MDW8077079.1 D-2-hydroxyacid dehydrogenase [Nitrososphaerota archaeon]